MLTKGYVLSRGMSLIELMVGIAIVVIVMMFGLPSFSAWIQNTQIRTAAEGVLNGLQLARSEAVKRNKKVEFVLSGPGVQGGTGWTVRLTDSTEIQTKPNGEGSANAMLTATPSSAKIVTFNGYGRVETVNKDGTPVLKRVNIDNPNLTAEQARELQINIDEGQPRMCDPVVTAAGDPRKC